MPRIRRLESLREELCGKEWREIDPEDIAYELMGEVYNRCRGHRGAEPSMNTLRGRYDAAYAYFDFLLLIGALRGNVHPLDYLARPRSKPNARPFLEETEDRRLAALELAGHEQAIYTLTRSSLRESEICRLEDRDVDLENAVVVVCDGKTRQALRRIPLCPEAVRRLSAYRRWRDANVDAQSSRFVRTRSGAISAGYIWKLIKAIGVRAELRLLEVTARPGCAPVLSTEITPHTLRRTWGSDLVRRDIPTTVFSKTYGHASKRVTEESYALISDETATRKILLAGGNGPFSLLGGLASLEDEIASVSRSGPMDVVAALERLEDVKQAAEGLISALGNCRQSAAALGHVTQ